MPAADSGTWHALGHASATYLMALCSIARAVADMMAAFSKLVHTMPLFHHAMSIVVRLSSSIVIVVCILNLIIGPLE